LTDILFADSQAVSRPNKNVRLTGDLSDYGEITSASVPVSPPTKV
jgi:hypothetical protein